MKLHLNFKLLMCVLFRQPRVYQLINKTIELKEKYDKIMAKNTHTWTISGIF